jgi:hypothetical protein
MAIPHLARSRDNAAISAWLQFYQEIDTGYETQK